MNFLRCRWDRETKFEPFPHYWEHCVGSDHATMALRADWQRQMTRCRRELGFRHARFHGLLSDDMGTLTCQNNQWIDSFYNTEQIFDFLLSIGMRPFIELSFMPSALSSGDTTVFKYRGNVTPPKKMQDWEDFIQRLGTHWVNRYGAGETEKWFFEVWNEPNLKSFWTGSQQDYFQFYLATARALRRADPGLKVGGPATAKNEWIEPFVEFCRRQDAPLNFISTHHYPTDAFGKPGDDTLTQLADSHRGALTEEVREARRQTQGLPLYYTEWCTSSNPFDDLHDQPYASAFISKTIMDSRGLAEGYSYWTFSDLFEENYFSSQPFHGGFGLLTVDGVPKPAYRAFEFLHRLGNRIHPTVCSFKTVDAWMTEADDHRRQILISNGALPRHPVQDEALRIELPGVKVRTGFIERVDHEHANPRRVWEEEWGKPSRLTAAQVQALDALSQPRREPVMWKEQAGTSIFEMTIPFQGLALLTLEVE